MQATSRNILLDVLKIIGSIWIIAIHCQLFLDKNEIVYQISINGIFRVAVPFFFCVNGFFLVDVFQQNRIKTWAKRVGILYLVWMLIYSYFWLYLSDFNLLKIIPTFLFGFNHLWYLGALLLGGLLLYRLKNLSNTALLMIAFTLYIIGLCIQYFGLFHVFENIPLLDKVLNYPPSHRNFLFFTIPFLNIGYVIKRSNFHSKLTKQQVLLLLLTSSILLVIDSLINYHYLTHKVVPSMNLLLLFTAPLVLITALRFKVTSKVNSKNLSLYSIALYLVHPFIIFLIFNLIRLDPTALTILTIVLSILASYLLIHLNTKLKYLL